MPTCSVAFKNLRVLGRSTPSRLNSKKMLSHIWNSDRNWTSLGAKMRFRQFATPSIVCRDPAQVNRDPAWVVSRDPAWVRGCPGRTWNQQFVKRSKMTSRNKISKTCIKTCKLLWNTLLMMRSSTPFQFNSKMLLSNFSPKEIAWKIRGAKRRFRWSTTPSWTSRELVWVSRDPAWVSRCPGMNWGKWLIRRCWTTLSNKFSKTCMPKWSIACKTLRVLES